MLKRKLFLLFFSILSTASPIVAISCSESHETMLKAKYWDSGWKKYSGQKVQEIRLESDGTLSLNKDINLKYHVSDGVHKVIYTELEEKLKKTNKKIKKELIVNDRCGSILIKEFKIFISKSKQGEKIIFFYIVKNNGATLDMLSYLKTLI
ncbi:MAG: hypothetical protein GY679_03910 [Mycoplasma sp.]|nr:hypothetical protein [Mycoplasma sp.]